MRGRAACFCSYFGCKPKRFSYVIRKASIAKLLTSFSLEFSLFIDRSSSSGIQSQGFLLALRWQAMRLVAESTTTIGIRRPSGQIEHFGEIESDAWVAIDLMRLQISGCSTLQSFTTHMLVDFAKGGARPKLQWYVTVDEDLLRHLYLAVPEQLDPISGM